ncbi:hypothetical protein Patl1_05146 [Pistacia atlantica]|uniref:Uncharacterized protein n=1 Tax=Pistacia atlantica TaxID=434234 RepID=A0ACC1BQL9_9ROSI|nr:hypothetical protein Patl1_05146 [Pistacia atlantica]
MNDDKEEEILSKSHHAAVVLPNLAKLSIERLPQLRCIWNGPSYHINLPSLTDVEVRECKSLTYVFTLSYVWSLVRLKSLKIAGCEDLEHLVIIEESDNDKGEEISSKHDLQIQTPFLSKLESVKINSCERLEYIFPISFARVLVQLEEFKVENAPQLKQVFDLDNGSEENNLQSLRIGSWNQLYETVLSGLKDGFFKNLKDLAPGLQKLEHLCLRENSELEEVFGDKDVDDVVDHIEFVLHQLERLLLHQLPSLTKFCRYHFIFPSLNRLLIIKGCPKISSRFFLDQDHSVHAKAKALTMGKEDEMAEFPSEPSIEISCFGYWNIQESLLLYIEKDEQSINQNEEEINIET